MIPGSYSFYDNKGGLDRQEWNQFVTNHASGNIFQTPEMYDLYSSQPGHTSYIVYCRSNSGELVGLICASLLTGRTSISKFLTSRAIVTGGPLIKPGYEHISEELLVYLIKRLPAHVIYLQVRNIFSQAEISSSFVKAGFTYEDHLNFLFDLKIGRGLLWEALHPTRRKQIRRAERRNVTTRVHETPALTTITDCYKILSAVYRRTKLPLAGIEFFIEAFGIWSEKGNLKIITAKNETGIIGFRFFFVFKEQIYDWYAGSDYQFNELYPNDILPWKIMEWGIENGCSIFDFGGAGNPDKEYGVRDYKEKFGGKQVNFGRYLYIRKPAIYRAGLVAVKVLRKLIRK